MALATKRGRYYGRVSAVTLHTVITVLCGTYGMALRQKSTEVGYSALVQSFLLRTRPA